jgi:putative ABC transport system permease protein
MADEVHFHIDAYEKDLVRSGVPRDEAARRARVAFGGVERVREECREARGLRLFDELGQDVRYSARILARNPGFAAVAVLTLALGIGATTALFSTINTLLLRQIPFEDPDRLMVGLKTRDGQTAGPVSTPDYFDYRELNRSFEDLGQFSDNTVQQTLTGGARPELVRAMFVTWNVFPLLRVPPSVGRHFAPEEQQGQSSTIVISDGFWQRRFGGSPDAVGTTVNLDSAPYTIVGVMPRAFRFLHEVDLWRLIDRDDPFETQRDSHSFSILGRLMPGVSAQQAQSDVDVISRSLEQQYPDTNTDKGLHLMGLHGAMVQGVRVSLLLLMATTVLVLLIACGNVAGLLLARGQQRLSEMAMRSALGAPRQRLVRQLLTESVMLAMAGAIVGIALAYWFQDLLVELLPMGSTGIAPAIDAATLGFALALTVATGVVVGVVPAFRGTAVDPSQQLNAGTRSSEGLHSTRLRSGLVVFQVAVSIVLLIGAGLLIRSLMHLTTVELGFNADQLLSGTVQIQTEDYPTPEERNLFFDTLLEDINAQPGVVSATFINKLPILSPWMDWQIWLAGQPRPSAANRFMAMARWVPPGYFDTMKIPLLEGRDVSDRDVPGSPQVVVISEAVVRSLFVDRDPIGQMVKIGWSDEPYQVIGVVADARLNRLQDAPDPALYMAGFQVGDTRGQVAVRTSSDPNLLVGPIENLLRQQDPNAIFSNPATMRSIVDDALGDFRIVILSLSIFSGVALALTAIGLYGVLAYHVRQRANEFGIRLALGATNLTLLGSVVRRGLTLVGVGLLLGVIGAYWASRLIQQLLYETQPLDPATYASAVLFLGLVGVLACVLPAWRATRISLVEMLRRE